MDRQSGAKIRRKPVPAPARLDQPRPLRPGLSPIQDPSPATTPHPPGDQVSGTGGSTTPSAVDPRGTSIAGDGEEVEKMPPLPPRLGSFNLVTSPTQLSSASTERSTSPITPFSPSTSVGAGGLISPATTIVSEASTVQPEKSKWRAAWDETVHFAGGLVSHPHESTKHFTILRHSPGLVLYRGPTTSVAVTIFSDAESPLPPDRTMWMQRRGFSGDTGMKIRSLVGARSSWVDVTPAVQTTPESVPHADERAWQRDITKFLKRAAKEKYIRSHWPRETHIVRIPAVAEDGYFRLVLCTGGGDGIDGRPTKRKVLCSSPIFRVASTSTDSSVLRGASLKTVPLEVGVKVASFMANNAVMNRLAPVTNVVQNRVQQYQSGFVASTAGSVAYDSIGLHDRVDSVNSSYDQALDSSFDSLHAEGIFDPDDATPPEVIGPDSGPVKPFPIEFQGKVARGTGRGMRELGIATANLIDVPEDLRRRFGGVYFGWTCIVPSKVTDGVSLDWHEALVLVGPSPYAGPSIVTHNVITAHILHDFGERTFFDAKIRVVIMGYLRPVATKSGPSAAQGMPDGVSHDAAITVASLSRDHWGPQQTLERMQTERSARSLTDKYIDTRERVQKQVDRIPAHWVGIRTGGAALRDRVHGNGGLWIVR